MARINQQFSEPSQTLMPNIWDILALLIVIALISGLAFVAQKMSLPFQLGQPIRIHLDPHYLPQYALETVVRMFIALFLSFLFSYVVGTAAAKSKRAEQLIIPFIDILQSVPILGYLSITVAGFIALFPNSMMGPEAAAIFAVFTSQVWNMTLSFYQSLKTIPPDLNEAAQIYQLSSWQKFWRLEAPFAMPGLLWNAMMSMSGGWFFIVAAEAISVANQNITLPGVGSYIALAIAQKNLHAIGYAILTMLVVIITYDQILFRPLVAWAEKFKLTDIPEETRESWLLNILNRARTLQWLLSYLDIAKDLMINGLRTSPNRSTYNRESLNRPTSKLGQYIWIAIVSTLIVAVCLALWHFIYQNIPLKKTISVMEFGVFTGLRVFILIFLCSIIWVPVGIWVGLNDRATRIVQPLAQILAAFPVNLFYPVIVIVILRYHFNFQIWCAPLMVLGTQWYILFNVIAGATMIPKELKLAAKNMQLKGSLKYRKFLLPAIMPYYVTGAITAAGGAWNASIVAEIIHWGHTQLVATGLGSYISIQTHQGHFSQIALGVTVMCAFVTLINLVFWRRIYRFVSNRYQLN